MNYIIKVACTSKFQSTLFLCKIQFSSSGNLAALRTQEHSRDFFFFINIDGYYNGHLQMYQTINKPKVERNSFTYVTETGAVPYMVMRKNLKSLEFPRPQSDLT